MNVFKIGEVATFQNCSRLSLNGMECVIVGALQLRAGRSHLTGESISAPAYKTQTADGIEWVTMPRHLRKKRPPTTDEAECRQAMLDCIERAKRGVKEPA